MSSVTVSAREVLRYMGARGSEFDVQWAIDEVIAAGAFKYVAVEADARVSAECVMAGPLRFDSKALGAHMRGCEKAVLFGATLGAGVDRLIMRANATDMSRAIVIDAAATALIEAHCDDVCKNIDGAISRFSPGYGDLSIEHQRELIDFLDAPRRIGLSLTGGLMMVPTKSVTAIIGIGGEKCRCTGCAACAKSDCAFRKDGT